MATITVPLDGASYRFHGFGMASPLYEKRVGPTLYAGDLTPAEWTRLGEECLRYFRWLRVHTSGGELHREGATHNYPARRQAALLADLQRRWGPFRTIASPFAAPSATLAGGSQTAAYQATSGAVRASQDFLATDANWQRWLDALDAELTMLRRLGCPVEVLQIPNETNAGSWRVLWSVYLTAAEAVAYVHKLWLGEGLTGGGLKTRHPYLTLGWGDPLEGTTSYCTALEADPVALAEVSWSEAHIYATSLTVAAQRLLGMTDAPASDWAWERTIVGEFGAHDHSPQNVPAMVWRALRLGRAALACYWTPLRDTDAMAPDGYGAFGLADLDTAAGTFAFAGTWWALKPYLRAATRAPCDVLCAATRGMTEDATANPAVGVYVLPFRRDDGSVGVVYSNCSGATRTDDVLTFTMGGAPATLTGTRTTFTTAAAGGSEGAPSAVATDASGQIAIGSAPTGTLVLLEMT